jgi:hypothetical protein
MRGINTAVLDGGLQILVVGPRGDQATAAEVGHYPQLGQHVFATMLYRQVAPEAEATDRSKFGGVVQHATAHPGDLVHTLMLGLYAQPPLEMEQIARIVQLVPLPSR